MDSGSQIDNVQSFVEVIGNDDTLWILLLGKRVTHSEIGQGRIGAMKPDGSRIRVDYSYDLIRYDKETFIKEFREIEPPNQDGRGGNGTYAIKDLLKAEGYRWNTTGWKAWCCTYPAQNFSVQEFFAKALWISRADGIELRFYDDLENMLASYRIDKGQWTCVVDNIPKLDADYPVGVV